MAGVSTMTVRIKSDVREKLERIAASTQRTKTFLAGEAIAAYVNREIGIIEGIENGLADVASGNLVPHEKVISELYSLIGSEESK